MAAGTGLARSAPKLEGRLSARLRRDRVTLGDGAQTTVHVAAFDGRRTQIKVACLREPQRLAVWCAARGVSHALVGGFFTRPAGEPLGELRTAGIARGHVAFDAPWGEVRACVHIVAGRPRIARRPELPCLPTGDLLQAGPLLVCDGRRAIEEGEDPEGFSAGARQFDSDITAGRYPRAALALAGQHILAVAVDGRSDEDAGLTLGELADLLVELGADAAINLDGGGSTSLVCGGRLRNRPRAQHDVELPMGRPIATALVFEPRY